MVSLGHAAYLGVAGYTCILLVIGGMNHFSPRCWR
jgi:ABC-type branched-subunit amino acid transport system permease subunit